MQLARAMAYLETLGNSNSVALYLLYLSLLVGYLPWGRKNGTPAPGRGNELKETKIHQASMDHLHNIFLTRSPEKPHQLSYLVFSLNPR